MQSFTDAHPPAFRSIVNYFEKQEWRFEIKPDRPCLLSGFQGENGSGYKVLITIGDDELFQIFVVYPVKAHENKLGAMAETLCRANYGLKIGKFELDFDDGEVRWQAAHRYSNGILEQKEIARLLGLSLAITDRYWVAFASVMFADTLPEQAIEKVEGNSHSRPRPRPARTDGPSKLLSALRAELLPSHPEEEDEHDEEKEQQDETP
jgi:hypothetical protein